VTPALAKLRYDRIFEEASSALEKRQFTLALKQFDSAQAIAQQHGITKPVTYDSLYKRAVKHYLLIQLSASQKKIWANQFDSATSAVERTLETSARYGLKGDQDLDSAIFKFNAKIQNQKCGNAADSINLRMIRADRSVFLRKYIQAMRYFNEALQMIVTIPYCGLDDKAVNDSLQKYQPAATYQEKLAEAGTAVSLGDYPAVVLKIDEASADFKSFNLRRFIVKPITLSDFVMDKNNPLLTEQVIQQLLEKGRAREAYAFLVVLSEQGVSAKSSKGVQESLGAALAGLDASVSPSSTAELALQEYNATTDWYTAFKMAYLAERKRLAK
jgi:hypothetical protein